MKSQVVHKSMADTQITLMKAIIIIMVTVLNPGFPVAMESRNAILMVIIVIASIDYRTHFITN